MGDRLGDYSHPGIGPLLTYDLLTRGEKLGDYGHPGYGHRSGDPRSPGPYLGRPITL